MVPIISFIMAALSSPISSPPRSTGSVCVPRVGEHFSATSSSSASPSSPSGCWMPGVEVRGVEVRGGSEEREEVKRGRGGGGADKELEELAACWGNIRNTLETH
jgi:hypothetical protein